MQKLIKRNPRSPLLISSSSSSSSSSSFVSLSVGFYAPFPHVTTFLSMRGAVAAASLPSGGGGGLGSSSSSLPVGKKPVSRLALPACRCANETRGGSGSSSSSLGGGLRERAWAVARPTWYCTVAGESGVSAAASAAAVDGLQGEGEGEKKGGRGDEKAVLRRRQRGSGSSSDEVADNVDLLTIPGVGPRNMRKLVDKGFCRMAELKQFYKDKFRGKSSDTMVEYLQSSVGIIHRNHAESITTYIKESVDEELEDSSSDVKPPRKDRLTFCVEGNISVGKTTFLQKIVGDTIELRDLVEVVPEPIAKWQDIGPDHFNILDAFYAEPHRYAYTFQNYVFVTRVMQERESSGGLKPLRLMERSVFSDRMVFVRAVHEAKWMNEMEISIYDSWFDPVVSVLPGLVPDGFIYLRASPDTCHKRMKMRKREEEGGVSLDYLRGLHEKHENWLFPSESGNHGVLSVSPPILQDGKTLHSDIRDKVFYLEGDHMHSSIQKVPALVLDCEANIDLNRDMEAKAHYARQVAEFFKYVKTIKKDVTPVAGGKVGIGSRQVMMPNNELLLPNGKPFPLDFQRRMAFAPGGQ